MTRDCLLVPVVLLLAAAGGAGAAERPLAVQLAKAEVAVAEAELKLARLQSKLELLEADRDLNATITTLSRRLGEAQAHLDVGGKDHPNRVEYELKVAQLKGDLASARQSGTLRRALLGQVWEQRIAAAEARLVAARIRLKIAVQQAAAAGAE
jgi:hypothetical protein